MSSTASTLSTSSSTTMVVAVLCASYAESEGELKAVESGYELNPGHFFHPRWPPKGHPELHPYDDETPYTFEVLHIEKRTAYAQIRAAVKSKRYACFFNLCDAAKDEDRAGVEVVRALEEFGVPFTGATSEHYEPSKPEMKMLVHFHGVRTPKGVLVRSVKDIARKCRSLQFPVIVKHHSGYSSVGMTKKSKCACASELLEEASAFIEKYEAALVEEFVEGDEATVLACADPTAPGGVRVFPPVQMRFPEGEDFKHFDLKWNTFDDIAWFPMDASHPAYERVLEVGKLSFQSVMDGVGYGRADVRIDRVTGDVVFLELNPNCGMMYEYGSEGSADWILRIAGANGEGHRDFIRTQITAAIARSEKIRPMFECTFDYDENGYVIEATRDIPEGTLVLEDEGRPTRLFTYDYVSQHWDDNELRVFRENAWPMGCDKHVYAVWDKQPQTWRPIMHSCVPNLRFVGGRSLNVEAARDIRCGEKLTMDFATFMDSSLPAFDCRCGSAMCRGRIQLDQTPGFLNGEGRNISSFHRLTSTADQHYLTTSHGASSVRSPTPLSEGLGSAGAFSPGTASTGTVASSAAPIDH